MEDVELDTVGDKVNLVFKMFDKNKNGKITRKELAEVLQYLDPRTWTPEAVETLLRGMDRNGDGELQFTEFWSWVCGHGESASTNNAAREALLDKAVEQEKAIRAVTKVKREKWEARKAEKDRLAAEAARKEAERAQGMRVSRNEFIEKGVAIGLNREVASNLFSKGDEDNDGEIDREELQWLGAGQAASVSQIKGLFQQSCRDEGSDNNDPSMQQVVETFTRWDVDGDGTISSAELERVIRTLNPDLGERTVDLLMREADASQDGTIDLFEFVSWLSGGSPKKKAAKEAKEAKVAVAMHRKRSGEARSLGRQRDFEEAQHALLPSFCKSRKVKAICSTLNPSSASKCEECKARHAWICWGCGFASYYDECVNGCSLGEFGWSCIAGKCAKRCGCKKKLDFWQRRGFAADLSKLSLSIEKMLC